MGQNSSQIAPSQSQAADQPPDTTQPSPPRANDAAMDDPATRDNELPVEKKKKRKVSGDATRPAKRSKKDADVSGVAVPASEGIESSQLDGTGQEDATGEITRKHSKKRSKKERALLEDGDVVPESQSSIVQDGVPQSTAQTADTDGLANGLKKKKRKRFTGRPSGLNLLPAGMEISASQDESTQGGAIQEGLSQAATNGGIASQETQETVTQMKRKKSKRKEDMPGHPSPAITNLQSSQPAAKKIKSPKSKTTTVNGAASPEHDNEEPQSTAHKSPESSRKRESGTQWTAVNDMLPTPPEAAQTAAPDSEEAAASQVPASKADEVVQQTPQAKGRRKSKKTQPAAEEPEEIIQQTPKPKGRRKSKKNQPPDDEPEEAVAPQVRVSDGEQAVQQSTQSKGRRKSKKTQPAVEEPEEVSTTVQRSPASSGKKHNRLSQHNGEHNEKSASKARGRPKVNNPEPSTPLPKSSRKKARYSSPSDYDGEAENNPESVDQLPSKISKKPSSSDTVFAKGPFTKDEKEMCDSLFKEILEDSGMDESEFRESLKSWKTATEFKEAVSEALPDRPAAAIRKFCQRRYHNLSRGPWTSKDDTTLRSAYNAHPDKWTDISAIVGRTAADCKDRWKNTVSIQDTQQLGPWSQEETAALIKAVDQTIKELKKSNKDARNLSRNEQEHMLSWPAVAKRLNNTRSAKRCNEKWQKIKKSAARASTTPAPLAKGLQGDTSKRLREVEKAYNQCDVGDLYDILTEIHTAIPDHTQHFALESTLWAVVAVKNPGSRFKSAMRRRGLHDAAEVYADELRETGVNGQDPKEATVAATAKALAEHLEGQWGKAELKAKRSYWPQPRKGKVMSSERVESDEDEDGDVGAALEADLDGDDTPIAEDEEGESERSGEEE